MTTTTGTAPVTPGDIDYLLQEHRKLSWFGFGWGKPGPRDDWQSSRTRLTSPESIEVIERVRDWLTTTVEPRRSRFGGPTDVDVAAAAARALGTEVSPGEVICAALLAAVPADFYAGAGQVTLAVNRESLDPTTTPEGARQ